MRVFRKFACICVGLQVIYTFLFCELNAQNDVSRILDSLLVTVSHVKSAADSSSPLQRFGNEEILRTGAVDAGDVLKRFSGVTVKDYGGIGGLKTVGIRGLGAQHTAVFYDGVAVGDCQSGQVDLGRYSVDNLSGIELSIGQTDDIYKPARMLASAGVVSLETFDAVSGTSSGSWKIKGRTASYDTYRGSLAYNRSLGKGWNISAFGEYGVSSGVYEYKIKNLSGNINGRRHNSDIEEFRGECNLLWNLSLKHRLKAKIYAYSCNRGIPGAVIVENPVTTERLKSKDFFGQLFYEYIPTNEFKMKFYLKHNFSYDRHKEPLVSTVSVNDYRQHETDFSYTAKWEPTFLSGLSLAFSEDMFYNNLKTTNEHVAMPVNPKRFTALTALSVRYVKNIFVFTGSMLHSGSVERVSSGDAAPDRSRFSSSLAFSVYPFENKNLCLRTSYKEIFRLPTFNDLYYREIGNYKLKPEKAGMYNIGAAYSAYPRSLCSCFEMAIDCYYGKVRDKIVAIPGIFVWKMSNVDRVEMSGADVNIASRFDLSNNIKWHISTSYSFMKAVNRTRDSKLYGEQITYTPRHSGSLDTSLDISGASVGYSLLWSDKRYFLSQNIKSNEVKGYGDHSLWISHNWNIKNISLLAKIEVKNISNVNYEVIRYYPMPGRNYALTLLLTI